MSDELRLSEELQKTVTERNRFPYHLSTSLYDLEKLASRAGELEAANKRLREALRKIAENDQTHWVSHYGRLHWTVQIAKAALRGEEVKDGA